MANRYTPTDGTYIIRNNFGGVDYCLERTDDGADGSFVVCYMPLKADGRRSVSQMWTLATTPNGEYRIQSLSDGVPLTISRDNVAVVCKSETKTLWKIYAVDNRGLFRLFQTGDMYKFIDRTSASNHTAVLKTENAGDGRGQPLSFERVDTRKLGNAENGFQDVFFPFTLEDALKQDRPYDLIIVGAGFGGGVLAGNIFDTNRRLGANAKKILLIDRGNIPFHSHCLNASRPTDTKGGRGQPNDWFYSQFKQDYDMDASVPSRSTNQVNEWDGGPLYGLGGRSSVWGLSSPRVHDHTLTVHFPREIRDALLGKYYQDAETLMKLYLPRTLPEHQHLMDRLNLDADNARAAQWHWGRIASEFSEDGRNFDFATGAYSPIDKLMEIAMSKRAAAVQRKQAEEKGQRFQPDPETFHILLGQEVREVAWKQKSGKTVADGVVIRTPTGNKVIRLAEGGRVVMAAGSVHSPAILLRSGVDLPAMGGCHITDHDMIYKAISYRYLDPTAREKLGSTKMQSYARLPIDNDVALGNLNIDSTSFLPREYIPDNDLPHLIVVFITGVPLYDQNMVSLDQQTKDPIVKIARSPHSLALGLAALKNAAGNSGCGSSRPTPGSHDDKLVTKWQALQTMAQGVLKTVKTVVKVEEIDPSAEAADGGFEWTKLGGVAHEVGTIPMQNPNAAFWANTPTEYCLDTNLKLRGNYDGVYVCDLSILPFNPEVNPSLTLAALALRLSDYLVPLEQYKLGEDKKHVLSVVNRTGMPIMVWVSRRCGDRRPGELRDGPIPQSAKLELLTAGGKDSAISWDRNHEFDESLFVYKLDPVKDIDPKKGMTIAEQGLDTTGRIPELYRACPGDVTYVY